MSAMRKYQSTTSHRPPPPRDDYDDEISPEVMEKIRAATRLTEDEQRRERVLSSIW